MTADPFSSAAQLARAIKARSIGCAELLTLYLERVDRFNSALNAIVVERREQALERARAADAALGRGEDWGPLHGVPMTVKESYDLAGAPTTWGVPHLAGSIARRDALAVSRLRGAGAVIFGKTNVPFMLADFQTYNDIYGTTNNPWDAARAPGGSSGGSAAALAAGLTALEAGSDIGGSIRNPAHFCGVFGHKPTWGVVPPRGHALPGVVAPGDLSVIGPLGRSAEDLELALGIMAGPDEIAARGVALRLPAFEGPLSELSVAVWRDDPAAPVDAAVAARVDAVAAALRDAGAALDFDARPVADAAAADALYESLLQAALAARMPEARYRALEARAAALAADDDSPAARLRRAQTASHRDWVAANERRAQLRWRWHAFFQRYDVLLAPIMSTAAFPHDHRPFGERAIRVNGALQPYFGQVFWAGLASAAYLPATAVPTGPDARGLPIGVQIIGPEYGDRITLGVARALEAAGFAFEAPPGFA